ncbi:hypothetical protein M422DRAFT_27954 [Sphaerobolus stellatus SS14]|nr:hypothetical protein M422DRAFT_27954 [Sphaerobolus stellatus SS14]
MLERLIAHNDRIPLSPESLTRFHSRSTPSISVLEYLRRIVRFTNVERTCALVTLHYIDQICARLPRFTISSLTVHRFLISSIAISSKALCDVFCMNSYYAKVGGLRVQELNLLEKDFLAAIDWRLNCTQELLQEYYVNLVRTHSSGRYKVADTSPAISHISPTSRSPSEHSRSASPAAEIMEGRVEVKVEPLVIAEPSSVLMGKTIPPPSSPPVQTGPSALEQNMAFAALQSNTDGETGLRPEKRPSEQVADHVEGDDGRPVKRKQ